MLALLSAVAPQTPAALPAPAAATEQSQFAVAGKAFQAGQYAVALADFKELIAKYPGNDAYKKFGAEAALNIGDPHFALQTISAIETAHPEDWQARLLLARAYQQTSSEPGHPRKRDEEITTVTRMHESGDHPRLARLRDFLLETVRQGDKTVQFYPSFVPWGPYKVSLIARVLDASGKQALRVTLESGDGDQPNFAIQHPAAAAAGERAYTLDGYGPENKVPNGQTLQTHFTYDFFVGKPSYDVVREKVLAIAAARISPLSGRTGPVNEARPQ